MTEYFTDVDERAVFVDDEREPITGRRVPKRDSKRNEHSVQSVAKRSLLVPAVIVAAVVLLLAGGAVALSKRHDGSKTASSSTLPSGSRAGAGSTAPGGGGGATSVPGLSELSVIYEGGKITQQVNASGQLPQVFLRCKAEGCRFENPEAPQKAYVGVAGPWNAHAVEDIGPICISGSTGVAEGHERFVYDWKLRGVGTTKIQGITVPARVVGTYVLDVPQVGNCLAGSHTEGTYDAKPRP
jgi:hypothetical protein